MSAKWTDIELKQAVASNVQMLKLEQGKIPYNKSHFNQKLRERALEGRSKASIEYRMQNISTVLEELCLPRITGYVPAKNVGNGVKQRIRGMLEHIGHIDKEVYKSTADKSLLDKRVAIIRKQFNDGKPQGCQKPNKNVCATNGFCRDPLVKAWILENANGVCECCREKAPFIQEDGKPFLEVHHVKQLSEGGSDTISNAIAVCPNCHRELHLGKDRLDLIKQIYNIVHRLVHE